MGYNLVDAAKNNGFELLPDNRYNLVIEAATIQPSQKDATKNVLNLTFKVVDDDIYKNRKLWSKISLYDKGLKVLVAVFKAYGSPLLSEMDCPDDVIIEDLLGKKVSAYVTSVKYNDKDSNSLSQYAPPMDSGSSLFQ